MRACSCECWSRSCIASRSGATSGNGDRGPAPLDGDTGAGLECADPPVGEVGADACTLIDH